MRTAINIGDLVIEGEDGQNHGQLAAIHLHNNLETARRIGIVEGFTHETFGFLTREQAKFLIQQDETK